MSAKYVQRSNVYFTFFGSSARLPARPLDDVSCRDVYAACYCYIRTPANVEEISTATNDSVLANEIFVDHATRRSANTPCTLVGGTRLYIDEHLRPKRTETSSLSRNSLLFEASEAIHT